MKETTKKSIESAQENRIYLGFDINKNDRLRDAARRICDQLNDNVIPRAKTLGLDYTLSELLEWAEDCELMNAAYIKAATTESTGNKHLDKLLYDKANEAVEAAGYYGGRSTAGESAKFVRLTENGEAVIDEEAAEEAAKVYLPEHLKTAREKYLKAIEAINDFLQGRAIGLVDVGSLFPVKDGKVIEAHYTRVYQFEKWQ